MLSCFCCILTHGDSLRDPLPPASFDIGHIIAITHQERDVGFRGVVLERWSFRCVDRERYAHFGHSPPIREIIDAATCDLTHPNPNIT